MRNRIFAFLIPLFAVVFIGTSCGQSSFSFNQELPAPSTTEADSPVEEANSAEDTEAAATKTAVKAGDDLDDSFSFTIAEETAEIHEGIPVGFTTEGRPYRGSPDAPVLIEEFSDFQCPFCGRFNEQTMPSLLENQIAGGEASLVYYDFPLESIHPQAFAAANAARCAGEQAAANFWQMHDLLYANMADWGASNPDPVFSSFAEELGLDVESFDACVSEMRYSEEIKADIDHALSRGVRSTPSFFLNNQPFIGAQPLETFNEAIAIINSGESITQEAPAETEAQKSPLQPPAVKPEPVTIDMTNIAAAMGDPEAPVTIVEFTDYQCPFCVQHALETLPTLIADQVATGEVYYILKDLPLDGLHPNARAAAKAARCAGEQDAYWEMHDALFNSQKSWSNLPEATFIDLASSLNLDADAFQACLDDEDITLAIQENVDEAAALGANSTPFFLIDGLPIPGAQPYDLFAYAIGEAKAGTLADAYVPSKPNVENAFAIGDPDAPVTIIEYTDYQCPYCSRYFNDSFTAIKENYIDTGMVYYIFKDFPLVSIHPQATKAAEAARCAAEQDTDAYLAMHDQLFINQSAWSGSADAEAQFKQFALDLGLDGAAFEECLVSGRMEEAVMADLEDGMNAGVQGTPSFFINRHTMSGAQPYAVFEQAIEQFLDSAG
ncbi:MAG: thioredoxin domain-containing protein [Candidatus Promineifilaceae bacterium]